MNQIYLARVTGIEKTKTNREGVFNQTILITPSESVANSGERKAYPPSFTPFTEVGGGVTAIPQVGALCIVLRNNLSEYDQILTYTPHEAIGPEGIYNPEELDSNAVCIKAGGAVKAALSVAPGGLVSLYSSPFAFLKLDGTNRDLGININTTHTSFPFGYENYEYADMHSTTGIPKVAEYKLLVSKNNEKRILADWDLETEQVNKLGAAIPYNDKVIIRAGTIYNYAADINTNKEKTEIGHVYQIETRQNTRSNSEKDTISILRLGYQEKDNLKYTADTKYAAGTILEYVAKRVNSAPVVGDYSSMLFRYGKLEANVTGTESENTKGEILRLQIYDGVVSPIGVSIVDPTGKGKGWKYEFSNKLAKEQFTQSFGILEDNSFYRMHIHAYPNLSKSTLATYNGIDFSLLLGGENTFTSSIIDYSVGKKLNSIESLYKNGVMSLSNVQFVSGTEATKESITLGKDVFELSVKASDTVTYLLKFSANKMTIEFKNNKNAKIELSDTGGITISNGAQSLKGVIDSLVDAINLMTVKHPQGPTLPGPINVTDFEKVKQNIKELTEGYE